MTERDFQRESRRKLSCGYSVLITAPTGLGKTRAAIAPFTFMGNNPLLTTSLIYTLPLRALTYGVMEELSSFGIDSTLHHGDEPESRFFSEQAIVTTIDQYLTAFAGAPLSWSSHLSHAAAGAVLSSYSVFDEVHLLSPRRALQLLFGLLKLRHRWGLLSCVMTATLPPSAARFFEEFCGLKRIEASPSDVQQRDSWRKVRLQLLGKRIQEGTKKKKSKKFIWEEVTPESICKVVKEKWESWEELEINSSSNERKIIVFVNTVDRAIQVYREIKEAGFCSQVFLAHSRFAKHHRREVERDIQTHFGRDASPREAILVSTQVAEAGLNISAPLVITELCPMDSLIQRAGRCQRFNMERAAEKRGLVMVVKPKAEDKKKWYLPYVDMIGVEKSKGKKIKNIPIAEITRVVLEEQVENNDNNLYLNWSKEKELIKLSLDTAYRAFLSGSDRIPFKEIQESPLNRAFQEAEGEEDGGE